MFKKLLKKLKNGLFCGNEFSGVVADIMGKEVPDNQKFDMLLKATDHYIKYEMRGDAKFATFENHYEKFMINGKEDREVLNHFYNIEYDHFLYTAIAELADAAAQLRIKSSNDLYKMLLTFKKNKSDLQSAEIFGKDSGYRSGKKSNARAVAMAISSYCNKKSELNPEALPRDTFYQ